MRQQQLPRGAAHGAGADTAPAGQLPRATASLAGAQPAPGVAGLGAHRSRPREGLEDELGSKWGREHALATLPVQPGGHGRIEGGKHKASRHWTLAERATGAGARPNPRGRLHRSQLPTFGEASGARTRRRGTAASCPASVSCCHGRRCRCRGPRRRGQGLRWSGPAGWPRAPAGCCAGASGLACRLQRQRRRWAAVPGAGRALGQGASGRPRGGVQLPGAPGRTPSTGEATRQSQRSAPCSRLCRPTGKAGPAPGAQSSCGGLAAAPSLVLTRIWFATPGACTHALLHE